jgi:hypothetical protein
VRSRDWDRFRQDLHKFPVLFCSNRFHPQVTQTIQINQIGKVVQTLEILKTVYPRGQKSETRSRLLLRPLTTDL